MDCSANDRFELWVFLIARGLTSNTDSGMDEVTLNTFDDIGSILIDTDVYGYSVFRGVSDHKEHKLIPSLGRTSKEAGTPDELEQSLLFLFKNESLPYLDKIPTTQISWLSVAQHHGLPTRLMDWSRNPLVAAYFAVYKDPTKDSAIYRYMEHKCLPELEITDRILHGIDRVELILPSHTTRRIVAQHGLFTYHPKADEEFISESMVKFIIPADRKLGIRQKLNRFGINHSTLFPDLDGLTKFLRWSQRYEP